MQVLRQVQGQIQPVTVLQLHDRLPLLHPVRFTLALLRPNISEVDGMAHQGVGGVILRENVSDLGQGTVHVHGDALVQSLRVQSFQAEEQLVREDRVHILRRIGEPDPDALHVVPTGQLDPDGIAACRRLGFQGLNIGERAVGRQTLHIVLPDVTAGAAFPIGGPYGFRVKVGPCRGGRGVDVLHDEAAQSHIVIRSVEEPVVLQTLQDLDGVLESLRMLDPHGSPEQQLLLCGHVVKPLLQPVVFRPGHLHAVQEGREAVFHKRTSICGPHRAWE